MIPPAVEKWLTDHSGRRMRLASNDAQTLDYWFVEAKNPKSLFGIITQESGDNCNVWISVSNEDNDPEQVVKALDAACAPPRVYVILVHHRQGINLCVGQTSEDAYDQLHDYVLQYWNETDENVDEIPRDRDQAIKVYFDLVQGDMGTGEWYEDRGYSGL